MTLAVPEALIHTQVGPRNARTNEEGLRHYRWEDRDLPSVTTIRRIAGMPFQLHHWSQNQVIERAINGYADLGKIIGLGTPEATKAAATWLRSASTEKRDIAASLGTRVHDAAATGRPLIDVSSDVAPFLRQFQGWLAESRAFTIATEKQVWNLKVGYAGTFDMLIQRPDGTIWVVDLKTGKGTYPEHAIQGIAYAMAQFVGEDNVKDARLTRLLRRANGVAILHLREDGWTWAEIKLTPELWLAFKGLLDFASFMEVNPTIDTLVEGVVKGAA